MPHIPVEDGNVHVHGCPTAKPRRTAVTAPQNPIRLYRHPLSGHAHRVELMLALLGLPCELVAVDMLRGAHKAPDFVAKSNPFGQVPVIEDGDVTIADSNAILVYLAGTYDPSGRWLPRDPVGAARVQQWLSVAAGQLAFGPAQARLAAVFGAKLDVERARTLARQLYGVLDGHLKDRAFLVGDTATIADIALYSYTAHAPEGGVALEPYPQVRAWLARIEALPGFVPMQRSQPAAAG
jgi:glutathione S-transferase